MRTRILTNTCRSFVHKCWCFRSNGTEMKAARNVKLVIVCLQARKSEWFEGIEFVVVAVLVWRVGADSLNKCLSASATSNSSSWLMLIQLANWTCFKSGCRGATGWIQYKSRFWYCLDWNWTASVLFINDGNTKAYDGFQEGERNFHREELKRSLLWVSVSSLKRLTTQTKRPHPRLRPHLKAHRGRCRRGHFLKVERDNLTWKSRLIARQKSRHRSIKECQKGHLLWLLSSLSLLSSLGRGWISASSEIDWLAMVWSAHEHIMRGPLNFSRSINGQQQLVFRVELVASEQQASLSKK